MHPRTLPQFGRSRNLVSLEPAAPGDGQGGPNSTPSGWAGPCRASKAPRQLALGQVLVDRLAYSGRASAAYTSPQVGRCAGVTGPQNSTSKARSTVPLSTGLGRRWQGELKLCAYHQVPPSG